MEHDGEAQVEWSSIRYEWSNTGGKERHRYYPSGDMRHISGWGGVGWQRQSPDMGRGGYMLSCSYRFGFIGLCWVVTKPVFKELLNK